ncbi:MAG: helix-turn-helix transcriptional regulator [Defluviitaleaceae bacterium]|nr:helix-turn-helix transcriptional regulator [Defluviitaleaceae bacterium]
MYTRLEELRTAHGKTKKEIAELLQCNRQVYARYERGEREITVAMLVKLAKFYETSVDYMLGLVDFVMPLPGKNRKDVTIKVRERIYDAGQKAGQE